MSSEIATSNDQPRILILAPSGRDAAVARDILAANGFEGVVCSKIARLCQEWDQRADVLLIAEEALFPHGIEAIAPRVASQPPWSDIPILVFVHSNISVKSVERLRPLRNVTPLDRPIRIPALISSLNTAVRARQRQYEIQRLMADLGEANRAKDDFLAMVSHELRTPLNVIRGLARSVATNCLPPDRAAKAGATIDRNAEVLARLVDDLLDMSRLQKRRVRLNVDSVDLLAVVNAAVDTNHLAADARGVALVVDVEASACVVPGDALRLEQVVSNLLSNAVKFTPAGGTVRVRLRSDAAYAEVLVTDTGEGIAPEFLSHVFEPFRQQQIGTGRQSGLGIGLALVRQFVELHGGTVTAESEGLGSGSTFTVRLPVQRRVATSASNAEG